MSVFSRSARRLRDVPAFQSNILGFRVVLSDLRLALSRSCSSELTERIPGGKGFTAEAVSVRCRSASEQAGFREVSLGHRHGKRPGIAGSIRFPRFLQPPLDIDRVFGTRTP